MIVMIFLSDSRAVVTGRQVDRRTERQTNRQAGRREGKQTAKREEREKIAKRNRIILIIIPKVRMKT